MDLTQVAGAERIDRRIQDPTPNVLPLLPNFLCPLRFRPSLFVQAGERAHLDAFTLLAKAI